MNIILYSYLTHFLYKLVKTLSEYQTKNTYFFDKSFDDGFWYWNNGFILIEAARKVALLIKEV